MNAQEARNIAYSKDKTDIQYYISLIDAEIKRESNNGLLECTTVNLNWSWGIRHWFGDIGANKIADHYIALGYKVTIFSEDDDNIDLKIRW